MLDAVDKFLSQRLFGGRWRCAALEHGLKTLEMRWPEVEPALLPRIGMGGAKGFRVRPGLECRRTVPGGM